MRVVTRLMPSGCIIFHGFAIKLVAGVRGREYVCSVSDPTLCSVDQETYDGVQGSGVGEMAVHLSIMYKIGGWVSL
ncbi:hypothetical protein SODALDRAFT_14875 [Sodiomyces alkalinus F11]|uniref:Uncharacterized protein n=1 Tax=Sodiomyces alkalinus (strain CBS 110278 / VKM F-3762 / F11) TaxID=1314773 RepID=A0A3N2Q6P9_SODAK|nr:hypothetical protein SODALDRAFT_14875 [Sodiomyces alkalinus F11]ROT42420.1 hypothetical protein SODALDRAFT_14875 [Sodiomyces alkalinus F11]